MNQWAITLNEYQVAATRTAKYPNVGDNFTYPALGLAGEAGEVANKVKKVLRDRGGVLTDADRVAIKAEIGDCLWYCAALANELNSPLSDIANENLDKLNGRLARGTISGDGDNR